MDKENIPDKPSGESIQEETETSQPTEPDAGLTGSLQATLDDLNRSIERMQALVGQLETGGADWDESVRLISEASQLAISSAQELDRVVQDVVYGSVDGASESGGQDEGEERH